MARKDYDPLREAQNNALDAANPSKGHSQRPHSPSWPAEQSMPSQQTAAAHAHAAVNRQSLAKHASEKNQPRMLTFSEDHEKGQGKETASWSIYSWDEDTQSFQKRLAELTERKGLSQSEAIYQIRREDNEHIVKARMGKELERKAESLSTHKDSDVKSRDRTLEFSEDRDKPALTYSDLNNEHARNKASKEGRTLTFTEDHEKGHEPRGH